MSQNTTALINTLNNDKSWEARRDAADALSSIKETKVVDALIGALNNDDEWVVRFCAADALGIIGDERAIPHLSSGLHHEHQTVQEHCARNLAKFGSKGIDILTTTLQNKESSHNVLRSFVIDAMGAAKNPVFLPILLEALNDPAKWVAVKAVRALGELGDPSVADTLLGLLKDPEFTEAAKQSMNKLGIDASDEISSAEHRAAETFLSNLKRLKVGMSESEVEKLVGGGVFGMGTRTVYRNQFGEFQLIIANGRLVEIPEGFGPAYLIKKMEADLSKRPESSNLPDSAPVSVQEDAKREVEEKAKRQAEEKAKQQAEEKAKRQAERKAENERILSIQQNRRLQKQCTLCGKPLGFFDKLQKKEKHSACTVFKE